MPGGPKKAGANPIYQPTGTEEELPRFVPPNLENYQHIFEGKDIAHLVPNDDTIIWSLFPNNELSHELRNAFNELVDILRNDDRRMGNELCPKFRALAWEISKSRQLAAPQPCNAAGLQKIILEAASNVINGINNRTHAISAETEEEIKRLNQQLNSFKNNLEIAMIVNPGFSTGQEAPNLESGPDEGYHAFNKRPYNPYNAFDSSTVTETVVNYQTFRQSTSTSQHTYSWEQTLHVKREVNQTTGQPPFYGKPPCFQPQADGHTSHNQSNYYQFGQPSQYGQPSSAHHNTTPPYNSATNHTQPNPPSFPVPNQFDTLRQPENKLRQLFNPRKGEMEEQFNIGLNLLK